jgi:hypothetical protein
MSPLSVRTIARNPPSAGNAARLELLQYYLLHSDDAARCAHASLEWLARYSGVKQALCLAIDADSNELVAIAGWGLPSSDVDLFSVPLTDARDPLVAALSSDRPTVFRPGREGSAQRDTISHTPFRSGIFTAIALRVGEDHEDDAALGLLLIRTHNELSADAVARVGARSENCAGPRPA